MSKFTKEVRFGSRQYFVDVRADNCGTKYFTIKEKNRKTGDASTVYVYPEAAYALSEAIAEAADAITSTNVKA